MSNLLAYFKIYSMSDMLWLGLGVLAQLMFSLRFILQWLASEKAKRSVVPTAFWWFSLIGGAMLLVYGIRRGEPVIILGQSLGIIVYVRNLMLLNQDEKTVLPVETSR